MRQGTICFRFCPPPRPPSKTANQRQRRRTTRNKLGNCVRQGSGRIQESKPKTWSTLNLRSSFWKNAIRSRLLYAKIRQKRIRNTLYRQLQPCLTRPYGCRSGSYNRSRSHVKSFSRHGKTRRYFLYRYKYDRMSPGSCNPSEKSYKSGRENDCSGS